MVVSVNDYTEIACLKEMTMIPSKIERRLTALGVTDEALNQFDVLVLPENIEEDEDNYQDTDENVRLAKLLKLNHVKCATSADLNIKSSTIERRSGDIWAGVIWVTTNVALPLVVGILSNYLYDRIKRDKLEKHPKQITVKFIIRRGTHQSTINFKGTVDVFLKILGGLQAEKEKVAKAKPEVNG